MKKNVKVRKAIAIVLALAAMLSFNVSAFATCSLTLLNVPSVSGSAGEKVVQIAKSQVGYTGSQLGATEAWCADFVSAVGAKAGQAAAVPLYFSMDWPVFSARIFSVCLRGSSSGSRLTSYSS